jgi:aromatic ring-opening dioxygenase catalytic subunit (LigB family)
MSDLPGRFITHGSPTLPLDPCPARGLMVRLGDGLPRPASVRALDASEVVLAGLP